MLCTYGVGDLGMVIGGLATSPWSGAWRDEDVHQLTARPAGLSAHSGPRRWGHARQVEQDIAPARRKAPVLGPASPVASLA